MYCPLCGDVEETICAFCHRVRGAGGPEGVWEQFEITPEEALDEILLFREKTEEKVERKRNGSTNVGTCTSVVRGHRRADEKAEPLLIYNSFYYNSQNILYVE